MTDVSKTLRENLRKSLISCRLKKGFTQEDVGELIGRSKTAVASWEQGLSAPNVITLYRLSKIYQVSSDDMIEGRCLKEGV